MQLARVHEMTVLSHTDDTRLRVASDMEDIWSRTIDTNWDIVLQVAHVGYDPEYYDPSKNIYSYPALCLLRPSGMSEFLKSDIESDSTINDVASVRHFLETHFALSRFPYRRSHLPSILEKALIQFAEQGKDNTNWYALVFRALGRKLSPKIIAEAKSKLRVVN